MPSAKAATYFRKLSFHVYVRKVGWIKQKLSATFAAFFNI